MSADNNTREEECIHQGTNIGNYNPKTGETTRDCRNCLTADPSCPKYISRRKYEKIMSSHQITGLIQERYRWRHR